MANCPACAADFDPLQGGYLPSGDVACSECARKARAATSTLEQKNNASLFVASLGSIFFGLFSFFFQHRYLFFLFPMIALGAGGMAALKAIKDPDVAAALGWKRWPTVAFGIFGIVLGLLALVAGL